jgi:HEAT repeat protein
LGGKECCLFEITVFSIAIRIKSNDQLNIFFFLKEKTHGLSENNKEVMQMRKSTRKFTLCAAPVYKTLETVRRTRETGGNRRALALILTVILLAGIGLHCSKESPPPTESPRSKESPPPPPEEIQKRLERGLKVVGKVIPETKKEVWSTYHQWTLDMELTNETDIDIKLGKDLFLVEASVSGSNHEGIEYRRGETHEGGKGSLFQNVPGKPEKKDRLRGAYNLSNSCTIYVDGFMYTKLGNYGQATYISHEGKGERNPDPEYLGFGDLPQKGKVPFKFTLDQGVWLIEHDRSSVRVVLPELTAQTGSTPMLFRLIAYFERPSDGEEAWTMSRTELVRLDRQVLLKLLETPENNYISRIFAANWLAQVDPSGTGPVLARVVGPSRQGHLLSVCLELLTQLKANQLGDHCVDLLMDEEVPNGIRRLAAQHIGTIKYDVGLTALVYAAKLEEETVSNSAIKSLGTYGGEEAGKTLISFFSNKKYNDRQEMIADSLAKSRASFAIPELQKFAEKGNKPAMDALVDAGAKDSFDFFLSMLQAGKHKDWRDKLIRGLRRSGEDRAIPVFLDLIKKESQPEEDSPLSTCTVVDEMIKLEPQVAADDLARLAQEGNLRAAQVLAGSNNQVCRDAVMQLVPTAQGPMFRILLDGLADNWPDAGRQIFTDALGKKDSEVVETAIQGLVNSNDMSALPRLIPLLHHETSGIRKKAASAIEDLGPGDSGEEIFAAIIATEDDEVARPLVTALIEAKWQKKDATEILAAKLRETKKDMSFQTIRLMRHLADSPMGPENYSDFREDQKGWVDRWIALGEEKKVKDQVSN